MATSVLLAAGACLTASGSWEKCALQPTECTDGLIYRSSAWLSTNEADMSTKCADQEVMRKMNSMGRCDGTADRFICTSHKSACRFSMVFKPGAEDCNLVEDFMLENSFSNSHFGFCDTPRKGEQDFCAWQFKECGDPERFQWHIADPFFANDFPECHCDDVRTGACVRTDDTTDMFCAVSKEVCESDNDYDYVPVLELESDMNIICKLCDTIPEAMIKGRTDINGKATDENTPEAGSTSDGNDDSDMSPGVIAGIAVGATVGVLMIAMIAQAIYKKAMKPEVSDAATIGSLPSVQ